MVSRSKGKSAVGKAAYISAEKIKNERDGVVHDYSRKKDMVHKEILLPDNAPKKFLDRKALWNAAENSEKRINSQTARDIEAVLPRELDLEARIDLVRKFCNQCFVLKGMCADYAIHDKGDGNPHVHILLTTRNADKNGFTTKNRDWNDRGLLLEWRERWGDWCNHKLYYVSDERIDHRSYKARGIEKIPQIHIGAAVQSIEKKGFCTDKGSRNRRIKKQNLETEISELTKMREEKIAERRNNINEFIGETVGCDYSECRIFTGEKESLFKVHELLKEQGVKSILVNNHLYVNPNDEKTVADLISRMFPKPTEKEKQAEHIPAGNSASDKKRRSR